MGMYRWVGEACGQMHAHGCVSMHVCVCAKRECLCTGASHGRVCERVPAQLHVHRCVHACVFKRESVCTGVCT